MAAVRTIKGKRFRLCVVTIDSTDETGRPRILTLLRENETVRVDGQNIPGIKSADTFATVFVPEEIFKKAN